MNSDRAAIEIEWGSKEWGSFIDAMADTGAQRERKRILQHLHAMVGTFDYDHPMYRKAVDELLDVVTDD